MAAIRFGGHHQFMPHWFIDTIHLTSTGSTHYSRIDTMFVSIVSHVREIYKQSSIASTCGCFTHLKKVSVSNVNGYLKSKLFSSVFDVYEGHLETTNRNLILGPK